MIAAQNLHLGIEAIKERLLKKKKARKESRQKGVTWTDKCGGRWQARYTHGKRLIYIGSFKTEKEAVEAYMKVSENPQEELKKLKAKKRNRTKIKKEEPGVGAAPKKKRKRNRTPVRKKTTKIKQEQCTWMPPIHQADELPGLPGLPALPY